MLNNFGNQAVIVVTSAQNQGQSVKALKVTPNASNGVKTYKINADGRLRISAKFLDLIGTSSTYLVREVQDGVVIVQG